MEGQKMNKNIYSKKYKTYYQNNAASILLYKSSRRNSRTSDIIIINHLISHEPNKKISDDRIINQFLETLERIIYYSKSIGGHLEMSVYCHTFKQAVYKNVDNDFYYDIEVINNNINRRKFSSVEQIIDTLFDIYALIYPYNKISRKELFNNPSVRYFINLYYKRG